MVVVVIVTNTHTSSQVFFSHYKGMLTGVKRKEGAGGGGGNSEGERGGGGEGTPLQNEEQKEGATGEVSKWLRSFK